MEARRLSGLWCSKLGMCSSLQKSCSHRQRGFEGESRPNGGLPIIWASKRAHLKNISCDIVRICFGGRFCGGCAHLWCTQHFWNIFPKIPSPDLVSQSSLRNFVAARVPTLAVRSGPVMYATSRSPFPSFGKRDVDADEQPAPKLPFFGAPPAQPAKPPKKPSTNSDALEVFHFFQQHKKCSYFSPFLQSVGKITGVGAKVVSELALYLAFNTGYFITNTYQFLSKEEQKQLAKQTVDKCVL